MNEFPQQCLAASREHKPYPQLSQAHPEAGIEDAYRLQQAFVALLDQSTVGYKAALTAAPAQQAMGLTEPIVGVLLATTPKDNGAPIAISATGVLETELGYTLSRSITAPVQPDNVLDHVASVSPMVELADPNMAARPTGGDLIATNSATFGYLKGQALDPGSVDLDRIETQMTRGGETLFGGSCHEVMGGQLDALCWLINSVLALKYPLDSGALLMTGSVGGVAPSQAGTYAARFSLDNTELECLTFELTNP